MIEMRQLCGVKNSIKNIKFGKDASIFVNSTNNEIPMAVWVEDEERKGLINECIG